MSQLDFPTPKGRKKNTKLWDWSFGFLGCWVLGCGLASLAGGVVGGSLFLPSVVDGRSLGYAVIVALPDDVGVGREGEDALDCLTI